MLAQCCKPDPLKLPRNAAGLCWPPSLCIWPSPWASASALGSKGWVCPCGFSGFGSLQGEENHLLAPTAGWVEAMGLQNGDEMRGKPCWCSKNSKAMHYYCTSTHQHSSSERFITISLGTHKCSQPLVFCSSLMSDKCCMGWWTYLKVQEDVFAPSHFLSPFRFLHTLESILYFLPVLFLFLRVSRLSGSRTYTTHAAAKPSWQYFLLTSGEGDPYNIHPV